MRYPQAQWKGCSAENYSTSPIKHLFIVVHVAGGMDQGGTDAWFNESHPPSIGPTSAHFSIGRDGEVHQYVDTNEMAYHCAGWNDRSIGIEHLGLTGEHLTAMQKKSSKALMGWIRRHHGTKLQYVVNPNNPHGGVIGHGKIPEGALSHPDCPGQPILDDVQKFLRPNVIKRVVRFVRDGFGFQRPAGGAA